MPNKSKLFAAAKQLRQEREREATVAEQRQTQKHHVGFKNSFSCFCISHLIENVRMTLYFRPTAQ